MVDPNSPDDRPPPAGREPLFNLPLVVTVFIAVCVAVELLSEFVLRDGLVLALRLRAAFIPLRYTGEFPLEVWSFTSPATYSLLHAGLLHVAVNMLWLAAFGSPLANRFGALRFILFWIVTAVLSAFFFLAMHSQGVIGIAAWLGWRVEPLDITPLVGASGVVSGLMGAAARYGFRIDRSAGKPMFLGAPMSIGATLRSPGVLAFLGVWFAINLVTGLGAFTPGVSGVVAWEAHIGGFLAGFFLVTLFDRSPAPG